VGGGDPRRVGGSGNRWGRPDNGEPVKGRSRASAPPTPPSPAGGSVRAAPSADRRVPTDPESGSTSTRHPRTGRARTESPAAMRRGHRCALFALSHARSSPPRSTEAPSAPEPTRRASPGRSRVAPQPLQRDDEPIAGHDLADPVTGSPGSPCRSPPPSQSGSRERSRERSRAWLAVGDDKSYWCSGRGVTACAGGGPMTRPHAGRPPPNGQEWSGQARPGCRGPGGTPISVQAVAIVCSATRSVAS
jgi:hypothetical protein